MLVNRLLIAASFAVIGAFAAPAPAEVEVVTPLTGPQVAAFRRFSHFAAAAYCKPWQTRAWTCPVHSVATKGFVPVAAGGSGGKIQYWFVGYDPLLESVIVSYEGTNPFSLQADLTDVRILMTSLDRDVFPGLSQSIQVHLGFAQAHAASASEILNAVELTMSEHKSNRVTLVGHSLGGALALLSSVFLPLHLPAETTYRTITYGMPRVGNIAFANYIDQHVNLAHINNEHDLIPIVPGRALGYHHPAGEIHIQSEGVWNACSGQDNQDRRCIVGSVPNIILGSIIDHLGPYDGVYMGLPVR